MKYSSILTNFGKRKKTSENQRTRVVFSSRAYASLMSEVLDEIETETGGVFLGYWDGEAWQVVESIDPGPNSLFEVAYFEYDQDYINHLINKVSRIYERQLDLIGLWHRHPGSFDKFSATDDETNLKYALMSERGAISALVNIDPHFRLTVYQVQANPLRYEKVPYEVLDRACDLDQAPYASIEVRANQIEQFGGNRAAREKKGRQNELLRSIDVYKAIKSFLEKRATTDMINDEIGTVDAWTDDDYVLMLAAIEADVNELEKMGIGVTLQPNDSSQLSLIASDADYSLELISGFRPLDNGKILFAFEDQTYFYIPGLISSACKEDLS